MKKIMNKESKIGKYAAVFALLSVFQFGLAVVNADSTVNGSVSPTMPSFPMNLFLPSAPQAPQAPAAPMGGNQNTNTQTGNTQTGSYDPNVFHYPQMPQQPQYPGTYPGYPYPGNPSTSTARVIVVKYVNGMMANASSSMNTSFALQTTTSGNSTTTATSTGSATLSPGGQSPYSTVVNVPKGMNFSLNEVMNANTGTMCVNASSSSSTTPFALVGYSVGNSMGEAVTASKSTMAPAFTNIMADKYVIVWNTSCGNGNSGQIGGDVTGGATTSTSTIGVLKVTSIDTQQGTAVADGTFANGWKFVFNITVPTNETSFYMKFADWINSSNASSTIPVANNLRISSAQASSSTPVVLTSSNTYSGTPLIINGDLDPNTPGRQIKVLVEMAVPSNTLNGSYTTTYGVKTQ